MSQPVRAVRSNIIARPIKSVLVSTKAAVAEIVSVGSSVDEHTMAVGDQVVYLVEDALDLNFAGLDLVALHECDCIAYVSVKK